MSPRDLHSLVPIQEQVRFKMIRMLVDGDKHIRDIVRETGIPRRTWRDVLLGTQSPTLKQLAYWAETYDCRVDIQLVRP